MRETITIEALEKIIQSKMLFQTSIEKYTWTHGYNKALIDLLKEVKK